MKRPSKGFEIWAIAVPLILVGIPLLYLLAMGPVMFLFGKGWISQATVRRCAVPYESVDHQAWFRATGIEGPLDVYTGWWWELAH